MLYVSSMSILLPCADLAALLHLLSQQFDDLGTYLYLLPSSPMCCAIVMLEIIMRNFECIHMDV